MSDKARDVIRREAFEEAAAYLDGAADVVGGPMAKLIYRLADRIRTFADEEAACAG